MGTLQVALFDLEVPTYTVHKYGGEHMTFTKDRAVHLLRASPLTRNHDRYVSRIELTPSTLIGAVLVMFLFNFLTSVKAANVTISNI